MAKEFIYKVAAEGDFGDLERELVKIRSALAAAKGSVNAFKEELERDSKGETEYKIVIRSEYDASGSKVAKAEIKEVSKEYEGLLNAIKKIEKEPQKGSVTSLRQQVNEAKQARDAISKYGSAIDGIGNRIQALDGRWVAQNQRVRELQRELDVASASNLWQRLSAEYNVKGLAAAGRQISDFVNIFQSVSIVAGQVTGAINNVVNALGGLQTFKLAFQAIGAGAGSANLALAESSRISLGLGSDLKTVRDSFQQLSPVIINSGGTLADVSGVVETLSSRFAAYGISGDRARRVTNGVIQAFAKGKLMAEELTQQISEADPAFKTDFAKALGVTVTGLEELVKAGEITSDVFLKTILKIGKSDLLFGRLGVSATDAADSLATAGTTVDQVRAKLATIGQLSLERFAKSIEPVIFAFLRFGAVITDAFDRISRLQGIDSIGNIAGRLAVAFTGIAEAVLRFAEAGLSVIGIIAKFADVLTRIPLVSEAIAIAIASKLIAPLAGLKTAFGNSISAATGWGKAIRSVTTFSGLSDTIKQIGQTSVSTAVQIRKLGKEKGDLGRRALFAETNIERLENKVKDYQKLISGQQAVPNFGTNPQAQAAVERYTQKLEKTKGAIETLRNSLLGIRSDQYANAASLDALANKKGLVTRAAGVLSAGLKATGNAAKSLVMSIGPLGVVLAAVAALTAAYQNANKDSNSILEQSKARVDALKLALEATGQAATQQKEPITGLALVWDKLSFVVSDTVDAMGRLTNALFGGGQGSRKAAKDTDTFVDTLGRVAAAAGAGALAGGALGLAFAGVGAGPGAAVGALTAALVALAAAGGDAGVKQKKFSEALEATQTSISAEIVAIRALVGGLDKINEKDLDIKTAKTLAGFNQAQTALKLVGNNIDSLKGQQKELNKEASGLAPKVGQAKAQYEKVRLAQEQFNKAQAEGKKAGIFGPGFAPRGTENLIKNWEKAGDQLRIQKQLLKEIAETDPDSKKYLDLQGRLAKVNQTVKQSQAEYNAAKKEIDDFAKANGYLTTEQKETIPTIAGATEKIKELQATLQNNLNPKTNPEKWAETTRKIAEQQVALDSLNDAAAIATNKEIAIKIKTDIQTGQINNSVQNVQRIVQALEQNATLLSIDSPELYSVLQQLEAAKTKVDDLNGRQALIRIGISEQNGAGSTTATLSEISRYIDALEQRKVSLSISSPEISGIIEKQNQAKLMQDAGSKSSGELRRLIAQDYWQEELRSLQESQNRQKEASQERQFGLQEELRKVKEISDARIESLRKLGPAEQRLGELRRRELEQQARNGGTEMERVSAQAQIERLDKEKQIAKIQEEAKAEEKRIQEAIRLEQANARIEEKNFRQEQLAIQQELLKLAREEKQAQIDAYKAVLNAREKGGDQSALATNLSNGAKSSENIYTSLASAAGKAEVMAASILDLDGKTITVNIKTTGVPGLWTGGPASAGTTYRVNELGKEGFLSNSGRLTDINRPRNALWRPPTSGVVIPAHIMRSVEVPKGGVNVAGSKVSRIASSMHSAGGSSALIRELRRVAQNDSSGSLRSEIATSHASQTMEIGRLTRAVRELVDKDWNVNVKVRNNGGTAYMNALNRLS